MGSEHPIPFVFASYTILEVSQYDFDMENFTVTTYHIKLPNNEIYYKSIAGLEAMANPFKVLNISADTYIQEMSPLALFWSK